MECLWIVAKKQTNFHLRFLKGQKLSKKLFFYKTGKNKTGVFNDPLGQPTIPAGSDCRLILKFWDGRKYVRTRTDSLCENNDHYRPGLWSASWIKEFVGQLSSKECRFLHFSPSLAKVLCKLKMDSYEFLQICELRKKYLSTACKITSKNQMIWAIENNIFSHTIQPLHIILTKFLLFYSLRIWLSKVYFLRFLQVRHKLKNAS